MMSKWWMDARTYKALLKNPDFREGLRRDGLAKVRGHLYRLAPSEGGYEVTVEGNKGWGIRPIVELVQGVGGKLKKVGGDKRLRSELTRLAYENPGLRGDLLPLIQKEASSQSIKHHGNLNLWVDLKINTLSGGWGDSGMYGSMYGAQVVFSAKVQVREGMGSWHTLYKGSNIKGRIYSDPGGGFYLDPEGVKYSSDRAVQLLVGDILNDVVSDKFDKPDVS